MFNALIFSDTHGRIPLMLRLVYEYQQQNRETVDAILVTGDLGVWPDSNYLDSSTRKHAVEKPEELGFQNFEPKLLSGDYTRHYSLFSLDCDAFSADEYKKLRTQRTREKRVLDVVMRELEATVLFIGGNHEDYDYIEACAKNTPTEGPVKIEQSGLLNWLPSGFVYEKSGIKITGISGIDAAAEGRSPDRYHPQININEDAVLDLTESVRSYLSGKEVDIVLTHDGLPATVKSHLGSELLEFLIQELNPKYHFFGHYHRSVPEIDYPDLFEWANGMIGVHINKLAFTDSGILRPRCMGHLRWSSTDDLEFEFVDGSWINEITANNWHHL